MLIISLLIMMATTSYAYDVVNLPESMTLSDAMGIFDGTDITGGSIYSFRDNKSVKLTVEQAKEFYYGCKDIVLYRKINPRPFSGYAINIYAKNMNNTFLLPSGVQIGTYGENSYICYQPAEGTDIMYKMLSIYEDTSDKYDNDDQIVKTSTDHLKLPTADWAVEAVKKAVANHLVPYQFTDKYTQNITREQFCILLANYLCVVNNYHNLDEFMADNNLVYLKNYFSDCQNRDNSINILNALYIVNGKTANTFEPDAFVTRQEAAKLITKAAQMRTDVSSNYTLGYADKKQISEWAQPYVKWVSEHGIMSGTGDNKFSPQDNYTVQQAIISLNRLYELVK